ncbi:arginine/serine-rich protein 1 [Oryzias melastigma]|uniref:Arginine/serine-rich protein 1 n=1 Tax=Oryzias melastigma TaxID=30732 RepID=A0A3B3DJ43_ORYME|nr:arginine/serine-rich protein 1 [Oryzias melastigma]
MAEQVNSHSAMAKARHTDGLNVIFDRKSPGSSHSRSRSRSSSSHRSSRSSGSGHYKRRGRRDRSSSSSSSSSRSRSSSRFRSRSHPRCRRRSSRCRCDEHRRSGRRHYRRSPSRRYRAHSRSYSRSPSPDRYYRRRRYSRSRSRSLGRWSRYRRPAGQFRSRFSPSPSPPRFYRRRSRSRSPVRSVSLSLDEKRRLLEAAKANAMKILGVEKIELPESVKPILSEEPEPRPLSPEPPFRRRHVSERTGPQDIEVEPEVSSPRLSSKGQIAFSLNNSMAKPTAVAPSPAKLTSRVDSYESRKPYGSWIPIGSGQSARK